MPDLDAAAINALALGLFVASCAGIAYLGLRAPVAPRLSQLVFLIVASFILFNKVYSPQFVVWLVPLAALAWPKWKDFLVWQLFEVLHFWAIWMYLYATTADIKAVQHVPHLLLRLCSAGPHDRHRVPDVPGVRVDVRPRAGPRAPGGTGRPAGRRLRRGEGQHSCWGQSMAHDAAVIGAGPNGLAAAADTGPGRAFGAADRTQLHRGRGRAHPASSGYPGAIHDLGSAVHPMALVSPFFEEIGLARARGLRGPGDLLRAPAFRRTCRDRLAGPGADRGGVGQRRAGLPQDPWTRRRAHGADRGPVAAPAAARARGSPVRWQSSGCARRS